MTYLRKKKSLLALVSCLAVLMLLLTGCGARTPSPPAGLAEENGTAPLRKLRVAYQGTTCEAPTYLAFEKGFFAEEGFDVELVQGDFNFIKDKGLISRRKLNGGHIRRRSWSWLSTKMRWTLYRWENLSAPSLLSKGINFGSC